MSLGLIACGSSTAPPSAGLHLLSGNNQTDTIQATLTQPLVVQITSTSSVAFQTVQFTAVDSEALVGATAVSTPVSTLAQTTDANGKAAVSVFLGTHAGRARLVVNVPTLKFTDTATFTVNPGAATGVQTLPTDTALYVNESAQLRANVVDRLGNARPNASVQITATGPVTIAGTKATGTGFRRVTLTTTSGAFKETTFLSVVPQGRFVATTTYHSSGIILMNFDGSQQQTLATSFSVLSMVWSPSGNLLAYTLNNPQNGANGFDVPLLTITGGGTTTKVDSAAWVTDTPVSFSSDGTWIYFNRDSTNPGNWTQRTDRLWRVHPDGTGDSPYPFTDTSSGPHAGLLSPDGKYLVYDDSPGYSMFVLNTATGVVTSTGYWMAAAAWSPTGDQIAFISRDYIEEAMGTVHVIGADGTGYRTLSQGQYSGSVSWSPDGNWLLVPWAVIGVTTTAELPLTFTATTTVPATYLRPVWQP